ncbi:ubiquitin-like-conjugating enzyme ATG10 isoform X2 [Xyrauchen texanus]|uniref:ubiquitin-like-conjugating enzyme ATG10 isoform X2 n=1 Tax=Xyrauchen texanus TaxID=154827 RepID=UPI0022426B1B|nr:ubiquitin-like-conjugating enzyme ATG10 isoform X2 [Xyrauchen texanus]
MMADKRNSASVTCYLDERTFQLCCQLFLQHSETIQDGWSWEQIKGTDEGFMKKCVLVPVRSNVLHSQHGCSMQAEIMDPLTEEIQEHLLLGQPFFMLHPCHTEEFMKPALDLAQMENKVNYIVTWLSVVGPVVGLEVPLSYSTAVSAPD